MTQSSRLEPELARTGSENPLRLRDEVAELIDRARIGGAFYLAGWLLIVGASGEWMRRPMLVWAIAAIFAVLALIRWMIRVPAAAPPLQLRRLRLKVWCVVLLSTAAWGAVYTLSLVHPDYADARGAAVICSIFFATAVAHTFALHLGGSTAAMVLVYAPGPILLNQTQGSDPTRIALSIYAIYLLMALLRSHRDYRRRLQLEDELREQRDLFRRLSQIDSLTGLCNRGEFSGRIERAFAEARQKGVCYSLLLLDIDHFKQVNDRHGHAEGDRCLIALAERLRLHYPEPSQVSLGRWGGEEFAILMADTGMLAARRRAEDFLADLRQDPLLPELAPISASVGVGELQSRHDSSDAWLRDVDHAMYAAKAAGRDCVRSIAGGTSSRHRENIVN